MIVNRNRMVAILFGFPTVLDKIAAILSKTILFKNGTSIEKLIAIGKLHRGLPLEV